MSVAGIAAVAAKVGIQSSVVARFGVDERVDGVGAVWLVGGDRIGLCISQVWPGAERQLWTSLRQDCQTYLKRSVSTTSIPSSCT